MQDLRSGDVCPLCGMGTLLSDKETCSEKDICEAIKGCCDCPEVLCCDYCDYEKEVD